MIPVSEAKALLTAAFNRMRERLHTMQSELNDAQREAVRKVLDKWR